MGYRGKVKEQAKARALRAQNRTLADIAKTLGVSKSSVSLCVRDVPFTPSLQLRGLSAPHRRPHPPTKPSSAKSNSSTAKAQSGSGHCRTVSSSLLESRCTPAKEGRAMEPSNSPTQIRR